MSITRIPLGSSVLEDLSELIGPLPAIRLSVRYGGRRLFFPLRPAADSELTQMLGLAAITRLCRLYGGCSLDVSAAVGQKARIVELRKRRWSVTRIAESVGRTERHVYTVLSRYRALGGSLDSPAELTDEELGIAASVPSHPEPSHT